MDGANDSCVSSHKALYDTRFMYISESASHTLSYIKDILGISYSLATIEDPFHRFCHYFFMYMNIPSYESEHISITVLFFEWQCNKGLIHSNIVSIGRWKVFGAEPPSNKLDLSLAD